MWRLASSSSSCVLARALRPRRSTTSGQGRPRPKLVTSRGISSPRGTKSGSTGAPPPTARSGSSTGVVHRGRRSSCAASGAGRREARRQRRRRHHAGASSTTPTSSAASSRSAPRPPDVLPQYIVIENLRSAARSPATPSPTTPGTPTIAYGTTRRRSTSRRGQHITIRGCNLHDAGNGLFVGIYDGDRRTSWSRGNYIYDNGNVGSVFEHNNYTAASGSSSSTTASGRSAPGASGNNLKDRSIGPRGPLQLDRGRQPPARSRRRRGRSVVVIDPRYRTTYVYGNVLIEPDGAGNSQIVHYGGDSGDDGDLPEGHAALLRQHRRLDARPGTRRCSGSRPTTRPPTCGTTSST